jgi:hypothetical protein
VLKIREGVDRREFHVTRSCVLHTLIRDRAGGEHGIERIGILT